MRNGRHPPQCSGESSNASGPSPKGDLQSALLRRSLERQLAEKEKEIAHLRKEMEQLKASRPVGTLSSETIASDGVEGNGMD